MEMFKPVLVLLLLVTLVQIGSPLTNDEEMALLRLKDWVEIDPSDYIFCWDGVEKHANHCGRSGVVCEDGKVVSLTSRISSRKLLKATGVGRDAIQAMDSSLKTKGEGKELHYIPQPPSPPKMSKPPPQPSPSVPKHSSPTSHAHTPRRDHSPPAAWKSKNVLYPVLGIGTGLLVIAILIFMYHRYNKVVTVKPWVTGLSGQLQKAFVTGVPVLKLQEIEAACEDFSNIIGSLRDGILYKGTLSSGVEIVVTSAIVKSSKDWSKHAEAKFQQKVATLSKVNHKNFVNLLGYCTQEDPFTRMMVFEYAPNGTLYDHLHNKEVEGLNWGARLRIAMGIAYCLDYMHQLIPPVILQSIDSTSIHLTDDYAAKIADMELWSETVSGEADSGLPDTAMKQTPKKYDVVYEYGLILSEIISGRPPSPEVSGGFTERSTELSSGEKALKDIIDPELKSSCNEEDVRKIADVITSCLNPDPSGRPTMKEIAGLLREITAVHPDGATPKLSPLWWAELEIISTEGN